MKVLIVAPHPDDEVLGCGGTISKHVAEGDEVVLCIVTKTFPPEWSEDFHESRLVEIEKSRVTLGISKIFSLDFETAMLDSIPQKNVNSKLIDIVEKCNPDIMYIPFKGDLHTDHRVVFESCLVSVRPRGHCPKKVLAYETLSETSWGSHISPFVPNYYVNIEKHLNNKLDAMRAYKSEIKEWPDQRSLESIEIHAKSRGSEIGLKAAEAFMLVRHIDG